MVELVHWNPPRPWVRGPAGRHLKGPRRIDNFGDLLGPEIVRRILARSGSAEVGTGRLVSVGSIMHLARDGDVVWGTGVNGKVRPDEHHATSLDVRAVRGPLTRAWLESHDIACPAVFGDPGLLVPQLFPEIATVERGSIGVLHVPNLHDRRSWRGLPGRVLDPTSPLLDCLRTIAAADRVIASSLHGLVVADALGIPAVRVRSRLEPDFKYDDYYSGTGRGPQPTVAGPTEAGSLTAEPLAWDPAPLLAAFPHDLFSAA